PPRRRNRRGCPASGVGRGRHRWGLARQRPGSERVPAGNGAASVDRGRRRWSDPLALPATFGRLILVGTWLLKCNPAEWDIESFLGDGHEIDSWRLWWWERAGEVRRHDQCVLWVTGPDLAERPSGIWGLGEVAGEATKRATRLPE